VRALPVALTLMDQARGRPARSQLICSPEVYDEGFWSAVNAWAGRFGLTGPAGIVQASEVPGAG
jgi:hypothetical protein